MKVAHNLSKDDEKGAFAEKLQHSRWSRAFALTTIRLNGNISAHKRIERRD